jgi:Mn2+/Fe2+ NRAMP family transporter
MAVNDINEIRGALGHIPGSDAGGHRSLKARVLTLLAIVGPGLIVMVGDNDSGGVQTYVQAGQNFGLSLLWTLPLIIPVLIVNQEMVVRLGAVTGVGYARLINERFGHFWGRFSVSGLFLLNVLTIATEFIGVTFALGYLGVSRYISVPLAALALIGMTMSGSFRRWERFMLFFVVANFLVIPLAIFSHPHVGPVLHGFVTPHVQGGLNSTSIVFIIAIIGTTVAPWQLFFQQSNIVDKKITPRWINYERIDTVIGSGITVLAATLLISTAAFAFRNTPLAGHYGGGLDVARGLGHYLGNGSGVLFAIVLLNASIIGAAAVTLTTAYAFGDLVGAQNSLDRSFSEAKQFYALFAGLVTVAAIIVLIPHAPLSVITEVVQTLAGVLLPSTTVFALLLCNDKEVLGPWVNRRWLNVVASFIVSVLLALSLILIVSTAFPHADMARIAVGFGIAIVLGFVVAAAYLGATGRLFRGNVPAEAGPSRENWRMPSSALLERAKPSGPRRAVMGGLGGCLILSIALLIVKSVELGLHK